MWAVCERQFESSQVFYSGTESIHTSVCKAAATTATAATTAATTARFLISS